MVIPWFLSHKYSANHLSEYDCAICRVFAYKVTTHTTDKAFAKTPYAFPQNPPLPGLDGLCSQVTFLSGFKPEVYDCCVNSCLCYVGPHKDPTKCTYCNQEHYRPDGQPQKTFLYIPLIPQLHAFAANAKLATSMRYQHNHKHVPGKTTDVFDSTHYRNLRR
jgi:hypothetical protein